MNDDETPPVSRLFLSKMAENALWFRLFLLKTNENALRFRLFVLLVVF